MLKYIFFDLDDTILNFTAGEANALSQALSEAGIMPTQAVLDRYHVINQACWELLEEGRLTRQEMETAVGHLLSMVKRLGRLD